MKSIGVKQYLHVRTASSPVYTDNGDSISFITNYTGIPQVWELNKGEGWPYQKSFTEERIIFIQSLYERDEHIIGMDIGVNEKQQLFLLQANGELTSLTDSLDHIHHYGGCSPDGKWIAWSSNRRHPAFFDIYIQNLETLEVTLLFSGDSFFKAVKWSPDGTNLLIEEINSNLDNDLGLLHIASREVTWLTKHAGEAIFDSPQFSKEGQELYLLTNKDREFTGLASIDLMTKNLTWIDESNWDIEGLTINSNKEILAYTVNEGGISKGKLYHIQKKTFEEWKTPMGVISELTFSPTNKKLAYVLNSPTYPSDIWEVDVESKKSTRITSVSKSQLIESKLVEPELIHYQSFDQLEIPAFYYKPKNARNEKLPVVVFVHGGPESQIRSVYNPFLQYFLNRGYAVCTPNVRGSTGYGKTFNHLDDVRKRMDSVKDLTYLVEWLKNEGNADSDKIAIMGRSYGGFMVLAAITHYPDLWAAAIDIVGISSFKTFLEKTSVWRRKLREAEYGSIEKEGEFFKQIDPIHYTDKIQAPLMVLHGANDPRVPIEETEQIVGELNQRNHPVDYLRFEDEGHFFVKLKNNITAYTAVADFLDKYIGK